MKTILKSIAITSLAIAISATGISANEESTKLRLLEEAIVESATTPAQKSVVSAYMKNVAQEKLALAKSYRERANGPRGGKVVYQNSEKKDLLKRASRLEDEAKRYEKF